MPAIPFLARYWKLIGMGLLALALGIQTLRTNHYQSKASNCAIERENDRKAFALAAKEAEAKAMAQKLALESSYRAAAERTDHEHQTALDDARRATSDYATRMRVQAPVRRSGTASPGSGGNPGRPEQPGSEAFMVAITREDLDICTENTLRLEGAFDWAKALNQEPLPDPAF